MKRLVDSFIVVSAILLFTVVQVAGNPRPGRTVNFDDDWRFHLGEVANGQTPELDDAQWRRLALPHDWSIEGEFDEKNPAGFWGGALPGGLGWYRKTFNVPETAKGKLVFIEFDGVPDGARGLIGVRLLIDGCAFHHQDEGRRGEASRENLDRLLPLAEGALVAIDNRSGEAREQDPE